VPNVLALPDFERLVGLSPTSGEALDWLRLGLPNVAPAPGAKLVRVPLHHAALWRLLFGGLIQTVGGNGSALQLGREMRKLCALPLLDDDHPEPDAA